MDRILNKITDWSDYTDMIEELFGYKIDNNIQYIIEDYQNGSTYWHDDKTLTFLAGDGFERIFPSYATKGSEQYLGLFKEIVEIVENDKKGLYINAKNKKGHSALILAIISSTMEKGTEKAKLLIEHGAEVSDAKKLIEQFLLPLFTETPLKKYTGIVERLKTILGYIEKRNKARKLKFSPKAKVKLVNILGENDPGGYNHPMRGKAKIKEPGVEEEIDAVEREEDDYKDIVYDTDKLPRKKYTRAEEFYEDDIDVKKNTELGENRRYKYKSDEKKNAPMANEIWNEIATRALSDD